MVIGWSFKKKKVVDNRKLPTFDKIKEFVDYLQNEIYNILNNNISNKREINGDIILHEWYHQQYNICWKKVNHFSKTQSCNVVLWRCHSNNKFLKVNSYIAYEHDIDNKGYIKIYLKNNKYLYANLKQHYRYYDKNYHIIPKGKRLFM